MSIAIFGDSHAGRIKRTWDRTVKTAPDWSTTWFIQRSMGTHPMQFFSDPASGGRSLDDLLLVDPTPFIAAEYNSVLVMGMGPSVQAAMQLAEQYQHPDMPDESRRSLTRATWESALLNGFVASDAGRVLQNLRAVAPETPITYVPQVRPMEWVNTREGHIKSWSEPLFDAGLGSGINTLYLTALRAFGQHFGVDVVDQPDNTVAQSAWTRPEYGLGAYMDESNQFWVRGDYFHANDTYATVFLDHLRDSPQFATLPKAHVWPAA